jgi:hypothetical protein
VEARISYACFCLGLKQFRRLGILSTTRAANIRIGTAMGGLLRKTLLKTVSDHRSFHHSIVLSTAKSPKQCCIGFSPPQASKR